MRAVVLFCLLLMMVAACGCIGGAQDIPLISGPTHTMPKDERGDDENGSARVFNDTSLCEQKEGKFRDLCLLNTAPQMRDETICEKVADARYRGICYGRVGVATGRQGLCDRIENRTIRAECKAYASKP